MDASLKKGRRLRSAVRQRDGPAANEREVPIIKMSPQNAEASADDSACRSDWPPRRLYFTATNVAECKRLQPALSSWKAGHRW